MALVAQVLRRRALAFKQIDVNKHDAAASEALAAFLQGQESILLTTFLLGSVFFRDEQRGNNYILNFSAPYSANEYTSCCVKPANLTVLTLLRKEKLRDRSVLQTVSERRQLVVSDLTEYFLSGQL